MKIFKILALSVLPFLVSCYNEINLDEYRDDNGKNLLTLNSIICPDSTIAVGASKTLFFSDVQPGKLFVTDLKIDISINGQFVATMDYDNKRNIYTSSIKPSETDIVDIKTVYNGEEISATGIVPRLCPIEEVKAQVIGPSQIFSDCDYTVRYHVTFTDDVNTENYYYFDWSETSFRDPMCSNKEFAHEYVFQKLAEQINHTLPGWEISSPDGLPFSDKGIEGKQHSIVVEEIIQHASQFWRNDELNRTFRLYAISKDYYDYLVSRIMNRDGGGIQGGMIDLGMADPIKVFNNISNGVGFFGCYNESKVDINVIDQTGPFPKP